MPARNISFNAVFKDRQTDGFVIANTGTSCSHVWTKICALCSIFSTISALLKTETLMTSKSVPGQSRLLKVTPVNSPCVISYISH